MMLAPVGKKMMHMQIYYWLLFLICDLGTMLINFGTIYLGLVDSRLNEWITDGFTADNWGTNDKIL
jgi:hypothetical protein